MKHKLLLLSMLIVCCGMAQPSLLKDINTAKAPNTNYLVFLTAVGNNAYFSADNGIDGDEPWVSDGTAAGTVAIHDVDPTQSGSTSYNYVQMGTSTYFIGELSGTTGQEALFKTNGTAGGTSLVYTFTTTSPSSMYVLGSQLIIFCDGSGTVDIWKSNGTTAGTTFVKTMTCGPVREAVVLGSNLIFCSTYYSGYDYEIYKTDGTVAGSIQLKDINPGTASSYPQNLTVYNSKVYFSASDGFTSGRELWSTNGTAAGTVMAFDLSVGNHGLFDQNAMAVLGGKLFFIGSDDGPGGMYGKEVYKTDGTLAGTTAIDMTPGTGDSYPTSLFATSNKVYFNNLGNLYAADVTTNTLISTTLQIDDYFRVKLGSTLLFRDGGGVLYKSDGTAAGTSVINPGGVLTGVGDLVATPTTAFFTGSTAADGIQLWKTTGTSASTVKVKNIRENAATSYINGYGALNASTCVFSANDGSTGDELWKTNGTTGGTVVVKDINSGSASSNPSNFIFWNGNVYFTATTAANGKELWKTDGTSGGTVMVKDIFSGSSSSNPANFVIYGSNLYFYATDASDNYELWKTDGTTGGTTMVKNINASSSAFYYTSYTAILGEFGGKLLLAANNGTNGAELWQSDGTSGGTVLLKDINSGGTGSSIYGGIILGSNYYFVADNGSTGQELWKTDGTAGGTVLVKDINTGSSSSYIESFFKFGSKIYFAASTSANGMEFWSSDGTTAGTTLVKDIDAGSSGSYPMTFLRTASTIYFSANTSANGRELWKSDGTTAGTSLVKDVYTGSQSGVSSTEMVLLGTTVYFQGNTSANGYELWKSDGTSGGTVIVSDMVSGAYSSSPHELTPTAQGLLYVADNMVDGAEIFLTNGSTPALLGNINADAQSSYAQDFFGMGTYMVFDADNTTTGRELYVLNGYNMITGVEEEQAAEAQGVKESPFNVYPVPSSSELTITSKDGVNKIKTYEIRDIGGRLISKENIDPSDAHTIRINEYKSGMYFIIITTESDNSYASRFIKVD